MTRATSMDEANAAIKPGNKRGSVILSPQAGTRSGSRSGTGARRVEHGRLPSTASFAHLTGASEMSNFLSTPRSIAASVGGVPKAVAVEAHKIGRQREAAASRRSAARAPGSRQPANPVIRPDSPQKRAIHTIDKGKQREARRQASLADLSNGQAPATASAPVTPTTNKGESTYPPRQRQPTTESVRTIRSPVTSQFDLATPTKNVLRRVASSTASPLRSTPVRPQPDGRKTKSYANLRAQPAGVGEKKGEKEHVSGFMSLQELLEQQGFEHTRVFTPKRPSPSRQVEPAGPSNAHLSPNGPTSSASASLGALLHPSRAESHSVRPQSSMLSLRGLIGLWQGSGVEVAPIELSPDLDKTPTQAMFPIDINEGGSDPGSDDTTVERSVSRANEWVWTQAGLAQGEVEREGRPFDLGQKWRERVIESAARSRELRGSDEAERSVVFSSTGFSSVASKPSTEDLGLGLGLAVPAEAGATPASAAASYAADYRSRPGIVRTVSDAAQRPQSLHALRHVVSDSALGLTAPGASLEVSQAGLARYQSFGFAALAFSPAAGAGMDGHGGEASSIEYEGSSDGSDLDEVASFSGAGLLASPLVGLWSGLNTLTHKASALFLSPPGTPDLQAAGTGFEREKGPELLKKARSRVALKPVVSSAELRFDFGESAGRA